MRSKKDLKAEFQDRDFFIQLFGDDIYAVGGYVRDLLMERETPHAMVDLLVTHHPLEKIIKLLEPHGKVDVVGKSFGVIKFNYQGRMYDIALPRSDFPKKEKNDKARGHKDFKITADPDLPVEKDLERRDFRCNSIVLQLKNNSVIDPLQGVKDIKNRVIRLTNPRSFPEDPLRVLRAARFASILEFSIEPAVYEAAKDIDLTGLSVERITEELFRILLHSPAPSVGLEEMFRLNALRQTIPELYRLSLSIQDSLFHPEKDEYGHHTVWQHTKITVDRARELGNKIKLKDPKKLALLLAALFHDVGKTATAHWEFKKGRMVITNNGHDIASEKITRQIFSRLKIFSWGGFNLRQVVPLIIRCHHRAAELWQNRDIVTKKAFNRLAADVAGEIELLAYLDAADRAGRSEKPLEGLDEESSWILGKFKELNVSKETIKPVIMGRDLIGLEVAPGPYMGKILKQLYQMQLDNEFDTRKQGLKIAEKLIKKEQE